MQKDEESPSFVIVSNCLIIPSMPHKMEYPTKHNNRFPHGVTAALRVVGLFGVLKKIMLHHCKLNL